MVGVIVYMKVWSWTSECCRCVVFNTDDCSDPVFSLNTKAVIFYKCSTVVMSYDESSVYLQNRKLLGSA